jgi:uncharacterized protein (DUF342 family)
MAQSSHPGISVQINSEASEAKLTLWPDVDRSTLSVELLEKILKEHGVALDGSHVSPLERSIADIKAQSGPVEMIVARAVPPIHGTDGALEWQGGFNPAQVGAAAADHNQMKVDHYNQTHYVAVAPGQHLATIRSATQGENGRDVTGRVLRAKPGAPLSIKTDSTVKVDDQGCIMALAGGIIQFDGKSLRVAPLFEVPGTVNFATGNIYFSGCVTIRGDVCDRFVVLATEDVTVFGLIGAATILCGRNLMAHCGIAAHDHGCLYAAGDAHLGYTKNGFALVQGVLLPRRELINCRLVTGADLIGDSAAVIGGSLTIGGKAVIGTLGAATGTMTTLSFGTHPSLKQLEEVMRNAMSAPSPAGKGKATDGSTDLVHQVRACIQQTLASTVGKKVDLMITKDLHPGAVIRCGRLRVPVQRAMRGPIRIHGDQEALFYQIADGVSHPLTDLSQPLKRAG